MLAPSVWKIRLILEFCRTKPIWMPKKPKLIFHSPAQLWRGFSCALGNDVPVVFIDFSLSVAGSLA